MRGEIITEVERILPAEQIFRQEPMSRHTTFRTGGPAELFLEIKTDGQMQKFIEEMLLERFKLRIKKLQHRLVRCLAELHLLRLSILLRALSLLQEFRDLWEAAW